MTIYPRPATIHQAATNAAAWITLRTAIATITLLASALLYLPANTLWDLASADGSLPTPPDVTHALRAEGARQVGFQVWWDDGRNTLYPARRVFVHACRAGSTAADPDPLAEVCVVEWKAFYRALRVLRDASS